MYKRPIIIRTATDGYDMVMMLMKTSRRLPIALRDFGTHYYKTRQRTYTDTYRYTNNNTRLMNNLVTTPFLGFFL